LFQNLAKKLFGFVSKKEKEDDKGKLSKKGSKTSVKQGLKKKKSVKKTKENVSEDK
jgi:hypothetical protein